MEQVRGRTVLLLDRFDRARGTRIPFLSAMSMLEAVDGQPRSYMEIADALRMHGAAATQDLRELWRRVCSRSSSRTPMTTSAIVGSCTLAAGLAPVTSL
jgi:hypothetical protein